MSCYWHLELVVVPRFLIDVCIHIAMDMTGCKKPYKLKG
jgi:hypothetical protein